MTIAYSGTFLRILCRWKGSVWKATWRELLIWLILYYSIHVGLQYGLSDTGRETAKKLISTFQSVTNEMPLAFMLAFYVTQVITRWWNQVLCVPWPDEAMSLVSVHLHDSKSYDQRLRRRAIARYLILTQIIALSSVSTRVRKRFPTLRHCVESGLMTKDEHELMLSCPCENLRWQLPLQWAQNLIVPLTGYGPGTVSPTSATSVYLEFNRYKAALRSVLTYDWICVPLVITQATGVGLYGYFLISLLARQNLMDSDRQSAETLLAMIPFSTILKVFFFLGWFKVAEDLLRPFGEADDDVELNCLIERHADAAMAMADQPCAPSPELRGDKFIGQAKIMLPHTKLSAIVKDNPPTMKATFEFKDNEELTYDVGGRYNKKVSNLSKNGITLFF